MKYSETINLMHSVLDCANTYLGVIVSTIKDSEMLWLFFFFWVKDKEQCHSNVIHAPPTVLG